MTSRSIGVALATFLLCAALAQAQEEIATRDFQTYIPEVEPVRIETSEAPEIDGDLGDPVWSKAALISEFYQVEPTVSDAAVETRVYLAYDDNNLYVGVHALDDEPDEIFATILQRDGTVWRDDMIRFYIDPFDTGLTGFGFDVNSLGARADRLVQARQRPIDEWDTIWDSAGQRTADGWMAEIVIPFRSLSFDADAESWGLMITRERAHKRQEIRWAGIDQSVNRFGFERAGRLVGIRDVNQGMGLEVELQGAAVGSRDWSDPRDDDLTFEPSATLRYKFTPALTGLLTFNTDFSDTPLDDRQINTGRFSLFFPETRDFFLQDAAFFEFGGQAFAGAPNGKPFFSRRIGIVNGQSVAIQSGAKLSGEIAGVELGLLSAQIGEVGDIGAQNLSVARATSDLGKNMRIGAIATHGDPRGDTDNSLIGFDYLYQTPSVFGGGQLQADLYYQRSFSSVADDDDSFGAHIIYPNDTWSWTLAARQVGERFRPALGFVNRPATREYDADVDRRFRQASGPLRWWQVGTEYKRVTDLDDRLETQTSALNFRVQTARNDEIGLSVFMEDEEIRSSFFLPGNLLVPAGEYENNGAGLEIQTNMFAPYEGRFEIIDRDFFGGTSTSYDLSLSARPSRFFDLGVSYFRDDISVPGGEVSVQIGSIDTVFNFSPDLSISTQSQYDNISESLSFFGRLRWVVRPESELFFSFGHGALIEGGDFRSNFRSVQTQAVLRFGNTFRF